MNIRFTGLRDAAINDISTLSTQLKSLHDKLEELSPVNGHAGPRPETIRYLSELASQLDETTRKMVEIIPPSLQSTRPKC